MKKQLTLLDLAKFAEIQPTIKFIMEFKDKKQTLLHGHKDINFKDR